MVTIAWWRQTVRLASDQQDAQTNSLRRPQAFTAFLAPLKRKNWFVYAKPPFSGPEAVLAYLGATRIASPSQTVASLLSTSAA